LYCNDFHLCILYDGKLCSPGQRAVKRSLLLLLYDGIFRFINCRFHTWLFLLNYSIYLVSPDGVAPSQMVGVSASVNLPLHHKVQKFSSGTGSPGWSQKRAVKWLRYSILYMPFTLYVSKNVTTLSCYNCDIHESVLIICGANVTEKVGNQKVLYLCKS